MRLSFDRMTVSQRKVIAVALGVAWTLFVLALFRSFGTSTPPTHEVSPSAPVPEVRATSQPAEPVVAADGESSGRARPLGTQAQRRAERVAASFVEAYASYSYRDGPRDLLERVRPWVTTGLAAQLRNSSGARALRGEWKARREVATVVVEGIQTQLVTKETVELLVIARRDVRFHGGGRTERPTYLVRVVPNGAGWRVVAVTL